MIRNPASYTARWFRVRRSLLAAALGGCLFGSQPIALARDEGPGFERRRDGALQGHQRDTQALQRLDMWREARSEQRVQGEARRIDGERQPLQPRGVEDREQRMRQPPQWSSPPDVRDDGRGAVRPGRLSPEERRALRQQINDANRNVYQPASR